jgi:outer membrane protein insertion porin family
MFDISYGNLGGYNRQFGFKTQLSSVEQRYVFHFREPWLFNRSNLPFKVFLSKEDTRAINIDTREVLYKIDKLGFLAGVEQELTKKLKSNLFYEYSFTETTDVEDGVILSKEDTGTLGISSVSPSLYYDTRDNPLNPSSGSFQSIVVKFASRAFLSEVGFVKTTFKSAWFLELYRGIICALSFGGGVAFSFEDTRELPLVERYFLGGSTTVRGYEHDMLGPKGEDDLPTGGNIFALVNSEVRFPLGKGIGLVTFVDGGNVWKTSSDINEDLRYTAGAGLRYKTPVGPVRLDYGHKISRREDESAGEVHFSFGHAF